MCHFRHPALSFYSISTLMERTFYLATSMLRDKVFKSCSFMSSAINEYTSRGTSASASAYRIVALNCNSIGKNPKRGQIFHFLKKKNPDITVLVDTRVSKNIESEF